MAAFDVTIYYAGRWDTDKRFIDYKTTVLSVLADISYEDLILIVRNGCEFIGYDHILLKVSALLTAPDGVEEVVAIENDAAVKWYFNFLKFSSLSNVPLILEVLLSSPPTLHQNVLVEDTPERVRLADEGQIIDYISDVVRVSDHVRLFDDVRFDSVDISCGLKVNDVFNDKESLKRALHFIAVAHCFEFRTPRSSPLRLEVVCAADGCSWKVVGAKVKGTEMFSIRNVVNLHSCTLESQTNDHKQATPTTISHYVKDSFSVGTQVCMRPFDIVQHMRLKHGVSISYSKAWRARECALEKLHGKAAEAYALIPSFGAVIMEKNPGSFITWELENETTFKYLFMALYACIEGYRSCRPVISVDGTFLKNKYAGTLLTATALDASNQIFPIAFAIVDSENDSSWEWFLLKLKIGVNPKPDGVIISDRHASIAKAVAIVFPNASHVFCMHHIGQNILGKFKSRPLVDLFKRCAKTASMEEFSRFLNVMEGMKPGIKTYLAEIGYARWSRCWCKAKRYNIMTTNTSESLNNRLRDARDMPVLGLLLEVRNMLQEWFYSRRMAASALGTSQSAWADLTIRREAERGSKMKVKPVEPSVYEVYESTTAQVVNISRRTCTCAYWQSFELPCAHACAAIKHVNRSPFNGYCSIYYSKDMLLATYSHAVYPVGQRTQWVVPEEVKAIVIQPPNVKRPVGRPKVLRVPHPVEGRVVMKCARCGGFGHNRKSCRNPLPAACIQPMTARPRN